MMAVQLPPLDVFEYSMKSYMTDVPTAQARQYGIAYILHQTLAKKHPSQ